MRKLGWPLGISVGVLLLIAISYWRSQDGAATEQAYWESQVKLVSLGMPRSDVERLLPRCRIRTNPLKGWYASLWWWSWTNKSALASWLPTPPFGLGPMYSGGNVYDSYPVSRRWRVRLGYKATRGMGAESPSDALTTLPVLQEASAEKEWW